MPVARKVWQQIEAVRPMAAALRLIISRALRASRGRCTRPEKPAFRAGPAGGSEGRGAGSGRNWPVRVRPGRGQTWQGRGQTGRVGPGSNFVFIMRRLRPDGSSRPAGVAAGPVGPGPPTARRGIARSVPSRSRERRPMGRLGSALVFLFLFPPGGGSRKGGVGVKIGGVGVKNFLFFGRFPVGFRPVGPASPRGRSDRAGRRGPCGADRPGRRGDRPYVPVFRRYVPVPPPRTGVSPRKSCWLPIPRPTRATATLFRGVTWPTTTMDTGPSPVTVNPERGRTHVA